MTRPSRKTRARAYGRRLHDVTTRRPTWTLPLDASPESRDYLGRRIAPETELERHARDGDR